MYQLSHQLIEQRNILSMLQEDSMLDDLRILLDGEQQNIAEAQSVEQLNNNKSLELIKQTLHGYAGVLDDKVLIHEGASIELDSDTHRPICRVHLFLLNDVLIIDKIKHDK